MNEFKVNSLVASEKLPSALALESYSPKRVLFWKNCVAHLRLAFRPTLSKKERVVHFFIGLVQLPPLIGQIAAIFEAVIIKVVLYCLSSQKKKSILNDQLLKACKNQSLSQIKALIETKWVDLNAVDQDGQTPLHLLLKNYTDKELIKIILEENRNGKNLELSLQNNDGVAPLDLAFMNYESMKSYIKSPLADPTGLASAKEIFRLLLEYGHGKDLNKLDSDVKAALLVEAAEKNDLEGVKSIIEHLGNSYFSVADDKGNTPLIWAIRNKNKEMAQLLIQGNIHDKGEIDLESKDENGNTPLMWAVYEDQIEIVELLLERGALVNAQDNSKRTALHWCIDRYKKNKHGYTIIKMLIEAKVDLNIRTEKGSSPLYMAVEWGNLEALRLLIDAKADLNLPNKDGDTVVHKAVVHGDLDALRMLIKAGVDLNIKNEKGYTAVHTAVMYENLGVVLHMLIKGGAHLDLQDNDGISPLLRAVLWEEKEIVEVLLDGGADLNLQGYEGNTPLHAAACTGNIDIVEMLIKKKVNIDPKNIHGITPLYIALTKGHFQATKALIEAGADTVWESFRNDKDLDRYDNFLSLLKEQRFENYRELFDLLSLKYPGHLKKYKEVSLVKAVAHTTNLEGTIKFNAILDKKEELKTRLQGGHTPFWMHKMHRSTTLMEKKYSNQLLNSASLCEILEFSSNQSADKISEILNRIREGKAVVLRSGYPGHEICLLIEGEHIIFCNRGALSRAPIEVFRYNQKLLNETVIKAILTNSEQEDASELLFNLLPTLLEFKQESLEKEIQTSCTLTEQTVGNCSWTSPEAAVWAFLFMRRVKELQALNKELDMKQIKEEIDKVFYS